MTAKQQTDRISRLARDLRPSGIREFFDIVLGMDDVISLGVGEPDFPTPWRVCDAVIESLRHGATSYTSNLGMLELREEIAAYLERKFHVSYDPETQILVTVGASEAVDLAMRALLNPGDEFLVTDPSYVSYAPCVELAHGRPVTV
ncbi:MAG: aminotransferase class I/II-fold pyridoxal phosphate-dependent enzyme, partial [Armatimonadota bacterium]